MASTVLDQSAGGTMSRRRVMIGTAWATPAVVVGLGAPPAAASGPTPADPLAATTVTLINSNGNKDELQASITLPSGVSLSGVSILVNWTLSTVNGPNPYVWIPAWNTAQLASGSDTFTRASLGSGDSFVIAFFKAATNSPYTVTISGTTSGGQQVSRSFPGTLL